MSNPLARLLKRLRGSKTEQDERREKPHVFVKELSPRARRHQPEPPGPGPGRPPEPGAPADREQPDAGGPGRAGGGVYRRYGIAVADAPGGGGESQCFSSWGGLAMMLADQGRVIASLCSDLAWVFGVVRCMAST